MLVKIFQVLPNCVSKWALYFTWSVIVSGDCSTSLQCKVLPILNTVIHGAKKNLTMAVFSQIWVYIHQKSLLNSVSLSHRVGNNFFLCVLPLLSPKESLKKLSNLAKINVSFLFLYSYNLYAFCKKMASQYHFLK